jgi:uncharacterized membrane-anchored protein
MKNKSILIVVFLIVALAQLFVPVNMILNSEEVIKKGVEYKFKVAPIDPNDPFRGKYVTLSFDANTYFYNDSIFSRDQQVYVVLTTDNEGYAAIDFLSLSQPVDNSDYVKAKINYVYNNKGVEGKYKLRVDYPFTRFYMEESKAPAAESYYWRAARDSTQDTYALVSVKDGDAVLKDVLINDISLKELTETGNKSND